MVVGDTTNSYTPSFENGVYEGDMWNFGVEAWCNLPGRYVTFTGDVSSITGSYVMSICNVGVFGTIYERTSQIDSDISLV